MLALLFAGSLFSVLDASVFIAWVRDPGDEFFPTPCRDFLNHLPDLGEEDGADDAWSLTWYGAQNPPTVLGSQRRHFHDACAVSAGDTLYYNSNGDPTSCYETVRTEAVSNAPRVILGHGRNNNENNDQPNPHPFVYDDIFYENPQLPPNFRLRGIFGRSYSFVHNGTLNVISQGGMEDKVGVGFAALDIFHDRPYGGRIIEGRYVDSEFLAMLILKHLLAQENYYWYGQGGVPSNDPPAGITSREDWAICRTAQNINIIAGVNTSINGVFSDGSTLWAIMKSDQQTPHLVYWRDQWSANGTRQVRSRSGPAGWTRLLQNNLLIMSGGLNGGPVPGQNPHSLNITVNYPDELRINPATRSDGNQQEPAISVNHADGSFVVVWVENGGILTGSAIKGRWYNQMGLAEDAGFTVYHDSESQGMSSPAIAHSPDGQSITVVWLDTGPEYLRDATMGLWRRSFTWNQSTHTWTPGEAHLVVQASSCATQPSLANPSIAYSSGNGDYAIVWEKRICLPPDYSEIHATVLRGDVVMLPETVLDEYANDHDPDVTFIRSEYSIDEVFAVSCHGLWAGTEYAKTVFLREFAGFSTQLNLAADGYQTSITRLDNNNYFVAYTRNGTLEVKHCQIQQGGPVVVETASLDGELDDNSRTDIAVRGDDATFYVCWDGPSESNGREIYCARGLGAVLTPEAGSVNLFPNNDQKWPVMAIAQSYPIHDNFYDTYGHPNHKYFEKRRMIVWQTHGQDGGMGIWGVAGQFRGIKASTNELSAWYQTDQFGIHLPQQLPPLVDQSITISDPVVYMVSNVTVSPAATLTIGQGVTIKVVPGCRMNIEGTLVANDVTFVQLEPSNPYPQWSGISVTGSAQLTGCTIDGAVTGIATSKASALVLDHCTIQNCETGLYAYQPVGSAKPQISFCTFAGNDNEGISLLGTAGASITNCEITGNGGEGILLIDSYAKLVENHIHLNGYPGSHFGLACYGSSPVLYCNEFENNMKGEIGLYNQSYPVLWNINGASGGNNTLRNDTKTLITLSDSYPLLRKGDNNFYLGTQGYFLADMSAKPPQHDISNNYWNPTLSLNLLYPSNPAVWTWFGTNGTPSECGGGSLSFGSGPEQLFLLGFTAEMSADPAAADASYTSLIATYPDNTLALAAAARLFEIARQTDSTLVDLRQYLLSLAATHPEDTTLVRALDALATRSWVEESEFAPPLSTYAQIMLNPPTALDSAYAALDFAVTTLRQQYEGEGGSGLDSEAPPISAATINNLRRGVQTVLPEAPPITHEGYVLPPSGFTLEQNYPNPFNAVTTIRYYLPEAAHVRLAIYNIVGQRVAQLTDGHELGGYHTVRWNAAAVASGVYFYRLDVGGHVLSKKMLLMK